MLPLGEVQIRIWDLCGWGGSIISLFLHNHPHQLLMILNIICHHLDQWVFHCIPFRRCYWGQTVWSIMLLLSIPHNMLGLGRKNWRGWRSEYQESQALGLPGYLGWWWYVCVGRGVLQILWWTQLWIIHILCLSPELCGLGVGRKHSSTKIIPQRIWCPMVCHSLNGYLWRDNWKLLKLQGRLDQLKYIQVERSVTHHPDFTNKRGVKWLIGRNLGYHVRWHI